MTKLIAENTYGSDISLLPKIQEFVISKVSGFIKDAERKDRLALAVAEAVSNGIEHGNKSDPNLPIKIKIEIEDNSLFIKIYDKGKGFNPEEIPDPTTEQNILKENGRGIFIIKNLVDKISFNFTNNGTETILEMFIK